MNAVSRQSTDIESMTRAITALAPSFLKIKDECRLPTEYSYWIDDSSNHCLVPPSFLKTWSWMSCPDWVLILNRWYHKSVPRSPHFSKIKHKCLVTTKHLYWIDRTRDYPFSSCHLSKLNHECLLRNKYLYWIDDNRDLSLSFLIFKP